MKRDRHRLFRDLRTPEAPAELRRRTLEAARAVAAEPAEPTESPARGLAERLWESRRLRLAWALLMVGLVGANWALEIDRRAGLPDAIALGGKPGGPLTLLEARGAVFQALLGAEGDEPARRRQQPPNHRSGRTS